MSMWHSPEIASQQILVGIILVGRLGAGRRTAGQSHAWLAVYARFPATHRSTCYGAM